MSRSNPITWRSVAIKDGSGSAALGNTAANFGRSAQLSFDSLHDQMQSRIDLEDERLTNEAIATALSGGPVSQNRRVDQNILQQVLERRAAHDQNLELGELEGAGMELTNSLNQKKLDNYDDVADLTRRQGEAQIRRDNAAAAGDEEEAKRQAEIFRRATENRAAASRQAEYFYGGEHEAEIRGEFDKIMDREGISMQERESRWLDYKNDAIDQQYADPDFGPKMAHRFGFKTVNDWIENSDAGRQWQVGRDAAINAAAEETARQATANEAVRTGLSSYLSGDRTAIQHDPNSPTGWGWGKGNSISADDQNVVMRDLKLDPEDKEVKRFRDKVNSEFKDTSAFRYVAENIVGDSGELPSGWEAEVDRRARDARSQAQKAQKGPARITGGTPEQNLLNSLRADTVPASQGEEESEPVDVFDPKKFQEALGGTPKQTKEARTNAVDSMQGMLDTLTGIQDDLPFLQRRRLNVFKDSLNTVKGLQGTEANGGLNPWQLNFIARQQEELQAFMDQIEEERRSALGR